MEAFLFTIFMGKAVWLWLVFLAIVISLLIFDLGVLHKDQHVIGIRESFLLSGGYIFIALLFGWWVWVELGKDSALDYYTAFVIEKSLSLDNLFVMSVIFGALAIPRQYQHRVLFWGILGVILLRGSMIGIGAALVHEFEWILFIFAAFLIITGIKLLRMKESEEVGEDFENRKITRLLKKYFHMAPLTGQRFFVKEKDEKSGHLKWHATPLFIALVTIELADVVFAIDSVPAVFAITADTYIVYTSNIFAILGLRALYFALSAMMERFSYLKYAVSLILIFIGAKVFITPLLGLEKFPPAISLSVTLSLLTGGVIYSLYKTRGKKPKNTTSGI